MNEYRLIPDFRRHLKAFLGKYPPSPHSNGISFSPGSKEKVRDIVPSSPRRRNNLECLPKKDILSSLSADQYFFSIYISPQSSSTSLIDLQCKTSVLTLFLWLFFFYFCSATELNFRGMRYAESGDRLFFSPFWLDWNKKFTNTLAKNEEKCETYIEPCTIFEYSTGDK